MKQRINKQYSNMRGATVLEILITLTVVSLGLLGVAGLQTSALKSNHDAYMYSLSSFLVNDISERMRANTRGLRAGNYQRNTAGGALATPVNCRTATCTAAQMAVYDLDQWLTDRVAEDLPDGDALIASTNWSPTAGTDIAGNPILAPVVVDITLIWRGRVGGNCDANGNIDAATTHKCFKVTVRI